MSEECVKNECVMKERIEALESEVVRNKDAHKEFYQKLDDSHTTVAVIEERLSQIKEDTEEIKRALESQGDDVQALKDKPGKRYDSLVDKAVWAILAAIIAFLLGRVGL